SLRRNALCLHLILMKKFSALSRRIMRRGIIVQRAVASRYLYKPLQILQLRPILNHSSPDIPNSSSSCSTEFEGGCIAHAAGAGGFGHDGVVTGKDDVDAQPAALTVSSRIQILKAAVFVERIG